MADMDYSDCIEIVEAVMEWMACKWTKSQMKRELREWFPGLSGMTCSFIFSAAMKEIRVRYNIDPNEYKGKQIAFYEHVIRTRSKMKDKLTAAERLDKLYGLEQLQVEDADTTARKIREALSQLNNQIIEEKPDGDSESTERRSVHEGDGEDNAGNVGQQGTDAPETAESEKTKIVVDISTTVEIDLPAEVSKDLKKITPEVLDEFNKDQDKKRKSS